MSTHEHERFQELACLRVYGELGPEELGALDAHLASCAACRSYADELARGLGVLAMTDADEAVLGPSWRAGLDTRLEAAHDPRPASVTLSIFAAGLAAGLLLSVSFSSWGSEIPAEIKPSQPAATLQVASNTAPKTPAPRFDGPPPRSTSHGLAARLTTEKRR